MSEHQETGSSVQSWDIHTARVMQENTEAASSRERVRAAQEQERQQRERRQAASRERAARKVAPPSAFPAQDALSSSPTDSDSDSSVK